MDQSQVKLLENIKSNNKVRRCGDGNLFEHDVTGNISENVSYIVIKSREPITSRYNYFELEIKSLALEDDLCSGAISIGVGDFDYPLDNFPGWTKYGVGYHSDDGNIYVCEGSGKQSSFICKEGDRMGCGIDFKESSKSVEIFFTKNSQQCCEPVKIQLPAKGFYPMIGMYKKGDQVQYLGHWHREAPINLLTAIKDGENSKVQQWVQNPECRFLLPQGGLSLDLLGIHVVLRKPERYSLSKSHVVEAFHLACSKGLNDVVEILLNCELRFDGSVMNLLEERDENGETALHASAKNNKADVVTKILQRKKNAHLKRNEDGYTAIMIAAENGCIEAYQVLWKHYSEHKASFNVNRDQQSHSEIPSELSQTDDTDLAPQQTYDVTDPDTIEMTENPRIRNQLEIPMDLSEPTEDENLKQNVIHLAAQSGQVGILKVMCELSKESYDGFLKQKDNDGNTPLHLACINGHEKVVDKFIKDRKVKADTMDLLMMNKSSETPAHLASKNGHSDIVNTFIQMSNETMTKTDINGQTMMHSAAASGHVEVLKVLIQHNDDVEAVDNNEETPLHLAARNGNVEAVKLMLRYRKKGGKKLVNHDGHTYLDVAIHSGQRKVIEVCLSESQNLESHEMFSEKSLVQLVRKMPDLAEAAMNKCITSDDWSEQYGSDQCEVTFDYALLEPSRNEVFRTMVAHERVKLLKHPLVQGLIDTLWKRYKWLFYFSLLFHIGLVILITSLALVLNNPTAEICQRLQVNGSVVSSNISELPDLSNLMMKMNLTVIDDVTNISVYSDNSTGSDFENITFNSDNNCGDLGNQSSKTMFTIAAAVIIIIISSFRLLLELIQFLKSLCNPYHRRYEYFLDFSNWLEVPLFIIAMIFATAQFSSKCLCIHDWQWNFGIISVVLVWSSLVVYLRKLDILDTGIYVLMLEILIIRFLKVIILTALLVIMFALAFHMTFAQLEDPRFIVSPFVSPLNSIWKTMTMMTGELDYESIFRQASEGSEDPIPGLPFPVIAYLLWIVFLIMMPILLSNLLVGLAVDDIKDILDSAEMRRIESKIDLIISIDNETLRILVLLCCCLPCLFWCEDKSGSVTEYVFERRKVGKETVKPFHNNKFKTLFQERKKFKSPECLSAIIKPDTIMKESLEERIDKQGEMLRKIQEMQKEMNELILNSMKSQSDRSTTK